MHAHTWIWKASNLCMHYGLFLLTTIHKFILNANRTGNKAELKKICVFRPASFHFRDWWAVCCRLVTCVRFLVGALFYRTWWGWTVDFKSKEGIWEGTETESSFRRSRRATVTFVIFPCLSLCLSILPVICLSVRHRGTIRRPTGGIFVKFNIWVFFGKSL